MQFYQCVECNSYYAGQKVTNSGITIQKVDDSLVCQANSNCKMLGLCVEIDDSLEAIIQKIKSNFIREIGSAKELGMCILLLDSSRAMGDHAFARLRPSILKPPSHPNDYAGVEDKGCMSKREFVACNVAQSIFDLRLMRNKPNIYLAVFLYDHRQRVLFMKSVETIFEEYSTVNTLALYLLTEMKCMNGDNDINSALMLTYRLVTKFENRKIDALGSFYPMMQWLHSRYDVNTGVRIITRSLKVHNIRVTLYTGGEQQAQYGALQSPFEDYQPIDPLTCVYIGQKEEIGAKELMSIARYCPIHGEKQFFLGDAIRAFPTLGGIIRDSQAPSGFCKKCVIQGKPSSDIC